MRLKEDHLEDVWVSSALFWPDTEDIDKTTLHWPNLEISRSSRYPPIHLMGNGSSTTDATKGWEGDMKKTLLNHGNTIAISMPTADSSRVLNSTNCKRQWETPRRNCHACVK